ncbi:MAG: hypothetical protein E7547_02815 [Ruminococcaceae bacterium]|nr:hypothetical protein [Oscillospiraceae bacterium]
MRRYIPRQYEISKNKYIELNAFCRQYKEFKQGLNECYGLSATVLSDIPKAGSRTSTVESTAERADKYQRKIDLIESTVKSVCGADKGLYPYLLKCVTEGIAWEYNAGVPCGRSKYYLLRRKFFFELSQKR